MIDPNGDQGMLFGALLATAHHRLADLLREAGRGSSSPGVADEIERQLDHELRAHLDTVVRVLESDLTQGELDQLRDDREEMLGALVRYEEQQDVASMRELVNRLCEHIELEELTVLASVGDRVGERRMATLGFRFAEAADTRLD